MPGLVNVYIMWWEDLAAGFVFVISEIRDLDMIDFGSLAGPGGPRDPSKRWGVSPPTSWKGLPGPRGRPDLQNRPFPGPDMGFVSILSGITLCFVWSRMDALDIRVLTARLPTLHS